MMRPIGWRGESYRHYLASKGVRSKYFASDDSFLEQIRPKAMQSAGSLRYEKMLADRQVAAEVAARKQRELEREREFERELEAEEEYEQMREAEAQFNDRLRKYGVDPDAHEFNGEPLPYIMKEKDGFALLRFHDPESPASEHPDTYRIVDDQGRTVWRSGTTQMAEYAYQGLSPHQVDTSSHPKEMFDEYVEGRKKMIRREAFSQHGDEGDGYK